MGAHIDLQNIVNMLGMIALLLEKIGFILLQSCNEDCPFVNFICSSEYFGRKNVRLWVVFPALFFLEKAGQISASQE